MKYKVFSVHDSKVGLYGKPFFMPSAKEALHGFSQLANDKSDKNSIGLWPEDYTLFELGEYEEETCSFYLNNTPIALGKALDFVKSV